MKILKFGGTSVGNAERIKKVLNIIEDYHKNDVKVSVVFSAFGGITDQLIELSNKAVSRDDSYLAAFQNIRIKHLEVFEELVTHSKKNTALKEILCIDQFVSTDNIQIKNEMYICCDEWTRPVLKNGLVTLLVEKSKNSDYDWKTTTKDYIRANS